MVKHHVVFGSIVVPGVVFVEMALEATKELFGHGVRITDVCLGGFWGARGMMEIYGFYRDFIGILIGIYGTSSRVICNFIAFHGNL